MALSLLINYSRSGGTLLCKCLAALPNVILISEVNPLKSAVYDVKEQAWLGYGIELRTYGYLNNIRELHDYCSERNMKLVVRDWTFVDFTPHELNHFIPSYSFENLNVLQKLGEVNVLVFVRDAIDIWISRWQPPLFFEGYLRYIKFVVEDGSQAIRYEDFCRDPEGTMRQICSILKIGYSDSFLNFTERKHILTGGTGRQRLNDADRIIQPLRQYISRHSIKRLNRNSRMIEANTMMGYPITYEGVALRKVTFSHKLWVEMKYRMKKIIARKPKDLY